MAIQLLQKVERNEIIEIIFVTEKLINRFGYSGEWCFDEKVASTARKKGEPSPEVKFAFRVFVCLQVFNVHGENAGLEDVAVSKMGKTSFYCKSFR